MRTVLLARISWPRYASYEEDVMLRKSIWNVKYDGKRIVMWDDTNIPFSFKPADSDEQRLTYSSYYAMNCAKGGVFLQLCGWMGVEELWVGGTSDSHYQEHTKIFEVQQDFAKKDLVGTTCSVIPFTNIFDKGYRVNLPAWRAGRQEVLQPIFAKSDAKFTGTEALLSASLAADRSGNERAVKRAKECGILKRGLYKTGNPSMIDDVWKAWAFQTNFIYKPVL